MEQRYDRIKETRAGTGWQHHSVTRGMRAVDVPEMVLDVLASMTVDQVTVSFTNGVRCTWSVAR